MKIKSCILLLGFIFIFAGHAHSDELSEARLLFYEGNASYGEGQFKEAALDYEKALALGFESGPLYYNLGNAYFKHGLLGKAILNYLRAKRLMPRDADLRSNLDYAQSLIKGGMVIPERKWLTRVFLNAADSFSLDRITFLSVFLYFMLSAMLILLILLKNLRRIFIYASLVLAVFLIVYVSIFFTQFHKILIQNHAVVIAEACDSKFEPFDAATTFFTLNEGESVNVIASREDWVKVRRMDGKQGWLRQEHIISL